MGNLRQWKVGEFSQYFIGQFFLLSNRTDSSEFVSDGKLVLD